MRVERIDWSRVLRGGGAFFGCIRCGRRRLIRRGDLSMFDPMPSPLPGRVRDVLNRDPHTRYAFDFTCCGCGAPYRLSFYEQERGMGGPWDARITHALTVVEDG